ncbi:MAG: 2-hydroxyacyl-CoA dehydratase, partial [Deltaproteobacteria bacterium]
MKIGITSTIPVEVVLAAGHTPCDLNNIFISASDPE